MIKFFELNKRYEFDITDVTSLIYVVCAVLGIMGYNPTILFCIGSIIATAFCLQARRINIVVLNVALLVLNLFNVIKMIC